MPTDRKLVLRRLPWYSIGTGDEYTSANTESNSKLVLQVNGCVLLLYLILQKGS